MVLGACALWGMWLYVMWEIEIPILADTYTYTGLESQFGIGVPLYFF